MSATIRRAIRFVMRAERVAHTIGWVVEYLPHLAAAGGWDGALWMLRRPGFVADVIRLLLIEVEGARLLSGELSMHTVITNWFAALRDLPAAADLAAAHGWPSDIEMARWAKWFDGELDRLRRRLR